MEADEEQFHKQGFTFRVTLLQLVSSFIKRRMLNCVDYVASKVRMNMCDEFLIVWNKIFMNITIFWIVTLYSLEIRIEDLSLPPLLLVNAWLAFWHWRCRRWVPPKCRAFSELYVVNTQKTALFIVNSGKTLYPVLYHRLSVGTEKIHEKRQDIQSSGPLNTTALPQGLEPPVPTG
jgi:hypothetical protein